MRQEARIWLTVIAVSLSGHAGALALLAPDSQPRGERMEGGSVNLADDLPSALVIQGVDVSSDPDGETLEPVDPAEAVEQPPVQLATAEIAAGESLQAVASAAADAISPDTPVPSMRQAEAVEPVEPQQTVAAIATVPLPRHNPRIDRTAPPEPRASRAKRGNADADRSRANSGRAAKPDQQAGNGGRSQSAGRFNSTNYAGRVMAHLRRHQRYPSAARSARLQGKAMVRFTIHANGSVGGVSLVRSSGHSLLDREALAMVRRASRFPPIPSAAGRKSMTITAPVNYRLR